MDIKKTKKWWNSVSEKFNELDDTDKELVAILADTLSLRSSLKTQEEQAEDKSEKAG